MPAFILGVAGGSGSGKSTLVQLLREGPLGHAVAVLAHDAYYLDRADMPAAVRDAVNWDHPDALDTALFLRHIDGLKAGRPADVPVYDFATHSRTPRTTRLDPRPLLILDGFLLLAIPEVRARLDLAVFVDTPPDLRLMRRILRDVSERGRTVQSVAEQYTATVRPMHELHVEPSRAHADVVVPWVFHNQRAVDALAARLADAARKIAEQGCIPPPEPRQ